MNESLKQKEEGILTQIAHTANTLKEYTKQEVLKSEMKQQEGSEKIYQQIN